MNGLTVDIKVEENYYSLPPECLFSMAARNNPKRSYLFVSKLIGKHIPVRPRVPFITGFLLASRLAQALNITTDSGVGNDQVEQAAKALADDLKFDMESVIEKPIYHFPGQALFIGFAETATALGHSVFTSFTGNIHYLHTTRENLEGSFDTLYFTEDHCHAPDQRCLISNVELLKGNDLLVLIDDEITTGNTCLNIIKTIQNKFPQKKYAILTILDWRSKAAQEKYSRMERELGLQIEVISLIKGSFYAQGDSPTIDTPLTAPGGFIPKVNVMHQPMDFIYHPTSPGGSKDTYLGYTGRFGITVDNNRDLYREAKRIGHKLAQTRSGARTLCLGTGEFMYIPFLIAQFMGDGVWVQSTTRSPVHPCLKDDYAVKYAIPLEDPFRPDIKNFVYNIPPYYYDEVFIFWERSVQPEQVAPLVLALKRLGITCITFVIFCR